MFRLPIRNRNFPRVKVPAGLEPQGRSKIVALSARRNVRLVNASVQRYGKVGWHAGTRNFTAITWINLTANRMFIRERTPSQTILIATRIDSQARVKTRHRVFRRDTFTFFSRTVIGSRDFVLFSPSRTFRVPVSFLAFTQCSLEAFI